MTETRRRTEPEGVAHDLDEDLFDFASVARSSDALRYEHESYGQGDGVDDGGESEGVEDDAEDLDHVLASIRDTQAEHEVARAAAAAPASRTPAPARPATPARTLREIAPALPSTTSHVARAPESSATGREPAPTSAPRRRSSSLVAVALAVTLLNSALAVVVLRPAGANERQDLTSLPAPPVLRTTTSEAPVHAHPSLDEAWAAVARGEYALARQRAYSLLALVDGIEGRERDEIESDCRYLIAQALYLDALSRREESP